MEMFKKIACFISGLLLIALFAEITPNTNNHNQEDYFCESSSDPENEDFKYPELYNINRSIES